LQALDIPFGRCGIEDLLNEKIRVSLAFLDDNCSHLFRFLPDRLVVCRGKTLLIDCKSTYSANLAQLSWHQKLSRALNIKIIYVFPELQAASVLDLPVKGFGRAASAFVIIDSSKLRQLEEYLN